MHNFINKEKDIFLKQSWNKLNHGTKLKLLSNTNGIIPVL